MILGNNEHAEGLKFYLLSRDSSKLKSEFHLSNGKVGLISNLTYMIRMHECFTGSVSMIPLIFVYSLL